MCFTFKKNNKQTKKPVNRFLQDAASAGIRSLQTSIVIKIKSAKRQGIDFTCTLTMKQCVALFVMFILRVLQVLSELFQLIGDHVDIECQYSNTPWYLL